LAEMKPHLAFNCSKLLTELESKFDLQTASKQRSLELSLKCFRC